MAAFQTIINKDGTTSIQVRIRKQKPTGEYVKVSKLFKSKRQASAWATKTEAQIIAGETLCDTVGRTGIDISLADALDRYAESNTFLRKKGKDVEAFRIKAWKRHSMAGKKLRDLTTSDFSRYRDQRFDQGRSISSVLNELSIIIVVLNMAREEWNISCPSPEIVRKVSKKLVPNNERTRSLTEVERLFIEQALANPGAANGSPNIFMIHLFGVAIETAMRQSELLNLEWKNINLEHGTARLPETKNGTERTVALTPAAINVLSKVRDLSGSSGKVFPVTASALKQSWSRAKARAIRLYNEECKKTNQRPQANFCEDLHWHDLRHIATTALVEKLNNPLEVGAVTGHKDARSLRRYYHPDAKSIAKKLAQKSA